MIYLIADYYHWEAYSQVRTIWEYFQSCKATCLNRKQVNWDKIQDKSIVVIYTSLCRLSDMVFKKLKERGVRIISFGLSDPVMYSSIKHKNCDLYCSNNYWLENSYFYPSVCDPKYHKWLNLQKDIDIIFIGTAKHRVVKNRISTVDKLRKIGFKIKCFGNKWPSHPDNYPFLEGCKKIEMINRAKLYLDLSNAKASLGHRIMEASCCATPILTFKRDDIKTLFKENEEILFYSNFKTLVEQLNKYLKSPHELVQIGTNASMRARNEHIAFKKFNQIFEELDKKTHN